MTRRVGIPEDPNSTAGIVIDAGSSKTLDLIAPAGINVNGTLLSSSFATTGHTHSGAYVPVGAASQGAGQVLLKVAGRYAGPCLSFSGATLTTVANTIYYVPLHQPGGAIDRIACKVAAGVASTTVRLGIAVPDANGLPSTILVDGGTIDSSSNGNRENTISATLPAGLIWLMLKPEGGTPGLQSFQTTVASIGTYPNLGYANLTNLGFAQPDLVLLQTGAPAGAFVAPGTMVGSGQADLPMCGVRWA